MTATANTLAVASAPRAAAFPGAHHSLYTARMAKKTTETPSPVVDFERSLDALEALVDKMEQGQMSLEDSLSAYEQSVGLYRRCQQALEEAELRVRLLSDPAQPENGEPFAERGDGG